MHQPILVINAGSSSIKFSVFETRENRSLAAGLHGAIAPIGGSARLRVADANARTVADQPVAARDHQAASAAIHQWFVAHLGSEAGLDAVGHRVVHGGELYSQAVLVNDRVLANLATLIGLAPLHQPHSLAVIRAIATLAPKVPQVACFDTAFHRHQPSVAQEFALPRELTAKGIRRYGFHGLSYEFIVSVLPEVAPEHLTGKLVVAHLGNGASMCAINGGRSVATTMGFTPVDGLVMGSRTGTLDPGVILFLLQYEGMDATAIQAMIYEQSGLLGVSGISSDMRTLLASQAASAQHAINLFIYRAVRELGSLAAALGGLDALIFTGGIGENAAAIRAGICRGAGFLGLSLADSANEQNSRRISRPDSAVSVFVIATDENLMIARHTRVLLDRTEPQ